MSAGAAAATTEKPERARAALAAAADEAPKQCRPAATEARCEYAQPPLKLAQESEHTSGGGDDREAREGTRGGCCCGRRSPKQCTPAATEARCEYAQPPLKLAQESEHTSGGGDDEKPERARAAAAAAADESPKQCTPAATEARCEYAQPPLKLAQESEHTSGGGDD
jgi:hypothetical protein